MNIWFVSQHRVELVFGNIPDAKIGIVVITYFLSLSLLVIPYLHFLSHICIWQAERASECVLGLTRWDWVFYW